MTAVDKLAAATTVRPPPDPRPAPPAPPCSPDAGPDLLMTQGFWFLRPRIFGSAFCALRVDLP